MNHGEFSDKDKKHKAGMKFKRLFFNHLSLAVPVFQAIHKMCGLSMNW